MIPTGQLAEFVDGILKHWKKSRCTGVQETSQHHDKLQYCPLLAIHKRERFK